MDKLSQIIGGNSNRHIDLSKERPVRTGVPSFFGQPVTRTHHVYESAESVGDGQNVSAGQHSAGPTESEKNQTLERQRDIVDKVNFSFAKKAELPVAENQEELSEEKVEGAAAGSQAKAEAAMDGKDPRKNVNLSIYV